MLCVKAQYGRYVSSKITISNNVANRLSIGSTLQLEGRNNIPSLKSSLLLRKSRNSIDHRLKHISSFFGILLSILSLKPFKFVRVDDGVALCELEIELPGVSRAAGSYHHDPTTYVLDESLQR